MKIKKSRRNIFIITLIILLICLAIGAYSLSQYTLIHPITPIMYLSVLSLLSGIFFYKAKIWIWITGSAQFLPNALCHFFCTCIISLSLFYICNYTFANDEEGSIRKTIVEEKYKKVHHKSRRIGRNRYTQGEAYNVYYMKVKLGNEHIKELQIEQKRYAQLHEGDTVPLFVSKGLFNIFVIKYNHISKYTNESSYRNQFKKQH